MNSESIEKKFVQRMREMLVSLPYDMKVLFEALSDENLPVQARHLSTVGAIYCLSPYDPLPDSSPVIGFCDDAIVLRLVLRRILELGGEDAENYQARFPEQFATLDEDFEIMQGYLGEDLLKWIQNRFERNMLKVKYKGKSAANYVEDDEAAEFLYEEGQAFTTQYEIDEKAASRLTSGKPLLDALRQRMSEENRRNS